MTKQSGENMSGHRYVVDSYGINDMNIDLIDLFVSVQYHVVVEFNIEKSVV